MIITLGKHYLVVDGQDWGGLEASWKALAMFWVIGTEHEAKKEAWIRRIFKA